MTLIVGIGGCVDGFVVGGGVVIVSGIVVSGGGVVVVGVRLYWKVYITRYSIA